MKIDDKLGKVFNIETAQEINPATDLPATTPEVERKEDDFDLARSTLRNLIDKNDAVITDLVHLARNSEHPRAYEVVGQLIKAQSEIAKDLMGIHKQKKDVDGDSPQNIKTQNNIVFAGSTSDLMKAISSQKAKTIDPE